MTKKALVQDRFRNNKKEVTIYTTEAFQIEAEIALEMITKWGMVAGIPEGEDSSGRSKLRIATPEEVVNRACAATEIAMKAFRDRGWVLTLPDLQEVNSMNDEEDKD